MRKKLASRKGNNAKGFRSKSPEKAPALPRVRPVWDAENRTLRLNGRVVIDLRRAAPSLGLLLTTFHNYRWKEKVPNPFSGTHKKAHQALRNAIKKLNHRQNLLRFHGDGDGMHVRWELIAEKPQE
jgi:hypothetical protein